VRLSQASQSERSRTTICRSCIGATSGPGSVVRSVNASPAPSGIGRHSSAKQNQSSRALVNFHFDFGGFAPVNSKKCDAGMRQRPFVNLRPGADIHDRRSLGPRRRQAPAQLHQFDASLLPAKDRGGLGRLDVVARFKVWGRYRKYHWGADLAERLQIGAVGHVIAEVSAHEREMLAKLRQEVVGRHTRLVSCI